jgi:hypothetical protein
MIARREAALEYLDDDHAAAAVRTWVRERLVGLGAVGIPGLGLCGSDAFLGEKFVTAARSTRDGPDGSSCIRRDRAVIGQSSNVS